MQKTCEFHNDQRLCEHEVACGEAEMCVLRIQNEEERALRYGFEVLLFRGTEKERWSRVGPSGGAPYEYATYEEADNMRRMCYGTDPSVSRTVAVS